MARSGADLSLKLYLVLTGAIFLLVAVLHLLRIMNHWAVVAGPLRVPEALSYLGCPIALGYFVWAGWLLRDRLTRERGEP